MKVNYKGHANKSGVYKITNTINGKIYIGSAKLFKVRASQHRSSLKNNKHQNKHLQASFNKHGADAFLFEVIEVVPGEKLARTTREQAYIDLELGNWKQCFNFLKKTVQKERTCFSKNPEEAKEKLSKATKERWKNPKYKEKVSKAISKGLQTPESKKLRSKAMEKVWQNTSHKEHMKKVMKKHHDTQKKTLDKYRKVAQQKASETNAKHYGKILDPLGNIHEIHNLQKFAREHNLNRANLQNVFKGKIPSYKGWRKFSKDLIGVSYISNKNHKQKSYTLLSLDGIIYQGVNITKFCETHNIRKENITAVVNGRRKSHKGWTKL